MVKAVLASDGHGDAENNDEDLDGLDPPDEGEEEEAVEEDGEVWSSFLNVDMLNQVFAYYKPFTTSQSKRVQH